MRDAENIRQTNALGIDMMGFIFWPKSSRYVSSRPAYMPQKVKKVGVFVNEDIETIKQIAEDYALDYIQLHGSESPLEAKELRDWKVIKAFNIMTSEDLKQTEAYEGCVNYFLFDTRKPSKEAGGWLPPGGTGEKFDWSVLEAYHGDTPFLLSGGIGPDDTERVKAFHHPKCIGIDLNSRFEIEPGLKDINKLKQFIENIK